ncbi:hypothetical protein GF312_17065 [Candidatus Poribacteria bacterium]|nr:hypothetical protein [Candidatus Poribacteria bacterium]
MKECDKIKELFGAYLHNEATPSERMFVEDHVKKCGECAEDLKRRKIIVDQLRYNTEIDQEPQSPKSDFAINVYKRIASDAMKRRTRQVFVRKFIMQPALAAIVLTITLTIGYREFYVGEKPEDGMETFTAKTEQTDKKQLRASLYVEEFFKRQGTLSDSEISDDTILASMGTSKEISSYKTMVNPSTLYDSQRLLEEADFINYSLRDQRRAFSKYQWLVDNYPDTDAAAKARNRIKSIMSNRDESRFQNANLVVDVDGGI